jgi:hypothetical protein
MSLNGMIDRHRAEDLLARDLVLVLHVPEHGRLDEVPAVADPLAAGQQLRRLPAGVDVRHHPVELLLAHLRPLRRLRVERVADLRRLHLRQHLLDELIVHLLLDEQARAAQQHCPG